jgi:dihydroxyacetone kinase-like protein
MSIGVQEVKKVVATMCDIIIENEKPFCELDSAAGDGDFGMSLAKGFREVQKQLEEIDTASIQAFLRGTGMIITEYCGGASGPIWGSAFRAAALSTKDKDTLELADVAQMLEAAVQGIQKRGGAKRGDKTLLDALIPATETLQACAQKGDGLREAFQQAAQSAAQGAEETKNYSAAKGRASYLGERSVSYPDAGAVAISVIFQETLKRM